MYNRGIISLMIKNMIKIIDLFFEDKKANSVDRKELPKELELPEGLVDTSFKYWETDNKNITSVNNWLEKKYGWGTHNYEFVLLPKTRYEIEVYESFSDKKFFGVFDGKNENEAINDAKIFYAIELGTEPEDIKIISLKIK